MNGAEKNGPPPDVSGGGTLSGPERAVKAERRGPPPSQRHTQAPRFAAARAAADVPGALKSGAAHTRKAGSDESFT